MMSDGVSLSNIAHPVAPIWKRAWWGLTWVLWRKRRFENAIETVEIELGNGYD